MSEKDEQYPSQLKFTETKTYDLPLVFRRFFNAKNKLLRSGLQVLKHWGFSALLSTLGMLFDYHFVKGCANDCDLDILKLWQYIEIVLVDNPKVYLEP